MTFNTPKVGMEQLFAPDPIGPFVFSICFGVGANLILTLV